jgi:hypothetical protein
VVSFGVMFLLSWCEKTLTTMIFPRRSYMDELKCDQVLLAWVVRGCISDVVDREELVQDRSFEVLLLWEFWCGWCGGGLVSWCEKRAQDRHSSSPLVYSLSVLYGSCVVYLISPGCDPVMGDNRAKQ